MQSTLEFCEVSSPNPTYVTRSALTEHLYTISCWKAFGRTNDTRKHTHAHVHTQEVSS